QDSCEYPDEPHRSSGRARQGRGIPHLRRRVLHNWAEPAGGWRDGSRYLEVGHGFTRITRIKKTIRDSAINSQFPVLRSALFPQPSSLPFPDNLEEGHGFSLQTQSPAARSR